MRNKGEKNIQKFSLRKYKGIGAASVLLGLMYLGTTPVFAKIQLQHLKKQLKHPMIILKWRH